MGCQPGPQQINACHFAETWLFLVVPNVIVNLLPVQIEVFSMLHLANVTLAFGSQTILSGFSWHMSPNDRIGLVGNNGSGKTTLMRMITGEQAVDEGAVILSKNATYAYLPQRGVVHEGSTLVDEASKAFAGVLALQKEADEILESMQDMESDSPDYQRVAKRYADIHDQLHVSDGYMLESKVEKVLVGLGFKHSDMQRDCGEFSGGWQMRIALAKVLLSEPNLLLLDEPTNYLDIEAREFLQNWLRDYRGAVLLVSHDRFFLDQVVNRITEISNGKLHDYHCNYTDYIVEREKRIELLRAKAERIEAERQKIQSFIDRFRYKADKAALVQSRVKQLEKLEKVEIPSVRRSIRFSFPQPERSGKTVVELENLAFGYDPDKPVFHNISFQLMRGEKVALAGINGAGKTTLIKTIVGLLHHQQGELKLGHNVTTDYFAQDVHKELDERQTVYETLEHGCPFDMVPQLRKLLGAFLFSGEEIDKKVAVLSGGERNRLALARMLLAPSNFLLMDEPTNHLDIDAKDVLLNALKQFDGTVLFVSHDRYFLDHLATRVLYLMDGDLYIYPGTYPDFLLHMHNRAEAAGVRAADPAAAAEERSASIAKEARVSDYKEKKKRTREKERLERNVAQLEQEIEELESRSAALLEKMVSPEMATDFAKLDDLVQQREALDKKIRKITAQWEAALVTLDGFET